MCYVFYFFQLWLSTLTSYDLLITLHTLHYHKMIISCIVINLLCIEDQLTQTLQIVYYILSLQAVKQALPVGTGQTDTHAGLPRSQMRARQCINVVAYKIKQIV